MTAASDRLGQALKHSGVSVRRLSKLLAERPGMERKGASRPMIARYLAGQTPPLAFLEAVAEITSVRLQYLLALDDYMTEREAAFSFSMDVLEMILSGLRVRWQDRVQRSPLMEGLPVWGPGLLEVFRRYFLILDSVVDYDSPADPEERDSYRRTQVAQRQRAAIDAVVGALRGPLEAFGVDPAEIGQEKFANYVHMILPGLLTLTDLSRLEDA